MKQLAQSLSDMFGVEFTATPAAPTAIKTHVEVTDTYNGESNYSWVKRYTLDMPPGLSNYAVVRRVKRHIGWSGKRTSTVSYGDMIELRPYGECVVCFITFGA